MSQFFTSSYDSSRNYIILSAVMNVDTLSKIDGLIHSNKTENLEKSQKIELAGNRSVGGCQNQGCQKIKPSGRLTAASHDVDRCSTLPS